MLALLERCVMNAGGTYAMADTDSMGVVAIEAGGLVPCPGGSERLPDGREAVRALSWEQVEAIRERFAALNPYDRKAVPGSVLKLEKENFEPGTKQRRQLWCYALSAKRYALFNLDDDGRPQMRKFSEHGLGHLLNPTDLPNVEEDAEGDEEREAWMRTMWDGISTEAVGHRYTWPEWLDRPALGRITASSPEMLRPFTAYNRGKPYAQRVKPYNFLLTTFVRRMGHPDGVAPTHFHLVAPFEADPRKWTKLSWMNLYDDKGSPYRITSERSDYVVRGLAQVKTYRDVLDEYRGHPESKSLAPDGTLCRGSTVGLLRRRPVTALCLKHVGKESNRLEEVEAGLVHDADEVYTEYADPGHDPWRAIIVPVLKRIPLPQLQAETGLSRTQVKALRNEHAHPRAWTQAKTTRAAAGFARQQLQGAGKPMPRGDLEVCAAYLSAI
jgi:hypothetical protein